MSLNSYFKNNLGQEDMNEEKLHMMDKHSFAILIDNEHDLSR